MKYAVAANLFILVFLSCNPITERMENYAVHGIDVSHYQSRIQWDKVATQKIAFSFVKASEGESLVDSLFSFNWGELARVGIKRGAYHFFRPTVDGHQQASLYINQVVLKDGDLPPVLDVETIDNVSEKQLLKQMQTWLYSIETYYGIRPIIYTNLKFYSRYLVGNFDQYPIWIARYNKENPVLANKQWKFWQYGNRGRIEGINGNVDLNVFHGSFEELEQLSIRYSDAALSSLLNH